MLLGLTLNVTQSVLLPLLAAAGLGAVVGWERESWRKPAGLRTHMMVALGAAAFTRLSIQVVLDTNTGDPNRIIAGVATGLGFLGAGSIIQSRGEIHGLTTAAGIWVVGGVGACCGIEAYALAISTVLLAVGILTLLRRAERTLQR